MPASSSTILAIDSTLRRCSVALWQSQSVIAEAEETTPNRQAARLIPLIEQMLDKNKVNYSDISAIACTIGPGSFTGIRIGLATAKAIALAANLPLMGVTTLEAIAWQAAQTAEDNNKITIAMNAYRGEIYLQSFLWQRGRLMPLTQPQALAVDNALTALPDEGFLAGDAQSLLIDSATASKKNLSPCPETTQPTASAIAELAAQEQRFAPGREVHPLYIRPPDAKLPTAT